MSDMSEYGFGDPLGEGEVKNISERLSDIYRHAAVLNKLVEEAADEQGQNNFLSYYLKRGKEMATVIQELIVSAHNSLIGEDDIETTRLDLDDNNTGMENEDGVPIPLIIIIAILVTTAILSLIFQIRKRNNHNCSTDEYGFCYCADPEDGSLTESEAAHVDAVNAKLEEIEQMIKDESGDNGPKSQVKFLEKEKVDQMTMDAVDKNGLEKVVGFMEKAREELVRVRTRTQAELEALEEEARQLTLDCSGPLVGDSTEGTLPQGDDGGSKKRATMVKRLNELMSGNVQTAVSKRLNERKHPQVTIENSKTEDESVVEGRAAVDVQPDGTSPTRSKDGISGGAVVGQFSKDAKPKTAGARDGKTKGATDHISTTHDVGKARAHSDTDDKEQVQDDEGRRPLRLMLIHGIDVIVKAGSRVQLAFCTTAIGYRTLDGTTRVDPCRQLPHMTTKYLTLGEVVKMTPCSKLPDPMLVKTESSVIRTRDVHFDSRNRLAVRVELFNLAPYDIVMDASVCYYKLHLFHSAETELRRPEDPIPSENEMESTLREARRKSTIEAIGMIGPYMPDVPRSHPLWSLGNQQLLAGIPFPTGVVRMEKRKNMTNLAVPLDFNNLAQHYMLYNRPKGSEPLEMPAEVRRINLYLLEILTSDQDTSCSTMHVNCTVCGQCKKWTLCWRKNCQLCNNALMVVLLNSTGKSAFGDCSVELIRDVVYHQLVSRCKLPAAENVRYPLHRANVLHPWAHEHLGSNSYYNKEQQCLECGHVHLHQARKSAAAYYLPHEMSYDLVYARDDKKRSDLLPFMMMNYDALMTTPTKEWSSLKCPRPIRYKIRATGESEANPLEQFHRMVLSTYQDTDSEKTPTVQCK